MEFKIPEVIEKRYKELCELIGTAQNGKLEAWRVAEYLGRDVAWLRSAINCGSVPFAFSDSSKNRAVSYIGAMPFFLWEMQNFKNWK